MRNQSEGDRNIAGGGEGITGSGAQGKVARRDRRYQKIASRRRILIRERAPQFSSRGCHHATTPTPKRFQLVFLVYCYYYLFPTDRIPNILLTDIIVVVQYLGASTSGDNLMV